MIIPTRSFTEFVQDMSAAVSASAGNLIDVSVGSVLRALLEANGAVALWIQWLITLVLQTTRAATSADLDLDSWMADFSLVRLTSTPASGIVTVSRVSANLSVLIPAGTSFKTLDGTVTFQITIDGSNPAWHPTNKAYFMPVGVTSLDLPVVAIVPGVNGNVLANTITLLASAVAGIDFIVNSAATQGGADAETDDALRVRFREFFVARSRGTLDAIGYAISQVQSGLGYVIKENVDSRGNDKIGAVLIIVDNGSGTLPASLYNSLADAANSVRPVGTTIYIQPPTIIWVAVSLSVSLPPGLELSDVQDNVSSSISTYINRRPIGDILSITRISQLVYEVEPRITNIVGVTLNNQAGDLVETSVGVFKFQSLAFN